MPWSYQLTKSKEQAQVNIVNHYKYVLQASPGGVKQTEKYPRKVQGGFDNIYLYKNLRG